VKLLISKRGSDDKTLTEIAQLKSGQSFGELSLIKNQPRAATVICMESCYFMTLSKESYLRLLGKSFSRMLEEKIEFLHSLPVFSSWTKKSLEKLSYFFIPKDFKQNEMIYFKGDFSLQVFVIINGDVELTISNMSSNSLPKTLKVAVISDKDFLGDDEVLLGVPRKYSARCLTKTVSVYSIAAQDFLSKIDKESLKLLRKTNVLRDSLRKSRLDGVRSLSNNEKSVSPDSFKREKLTIGPIYSKKKIINSPSKNLAFSPLALKRIEKRSLANLHSPTVSIIQNSPVTHRPKSVNVFINVKGFQPINLPPAGIFRRLQNRIKVGLFKD
jgi:CRP-like cAMP-binding protein